MGHYFIEIVKNEYVNPVLNGLNDTITLLTNKYGKDMESKDSGISVIGKSIDELEKVHAELTKDITAYFTAIESPILSPELDESINKIRANFTDKITDHLSKIKTYSEKQDNAIAAALISREVRDIDDIKEHICYALKEETKKFAPSQKVESVEHHKTVESSPEQGAGSFYVE